MGKLKALDENLNLTDKRVILRVDLNVPMQGGQVTDKSRINKIIPIIKEFINKKAKVILISHLGRPKGKVDNKLSRITIVTHGTKEVIGQIQSQLMRIVPVHNVTNLNKEDSSVEAEVALVYMFVDEKNKKKAFQICDLYRARKIENENNATIFEIAGTSERIDAFIEEISKLVVIEVVRSGPVAISTVERNTEEK